MKKILAALLGLALSGGIAQATSLEVNLNDYSVQAEAAITITEDNYGASLLNARFLYNDDEETSLGSVGFDFLGSPGNVPGLKVGAGALVYGGKTDDSQDFATLGLGARAGYAPPFLGGLGLSLKAFYAPRILSAFDADRLLETGAKLSFAITPKVRLLLAYQTIRAKFEKRSTWTIDEGLRVGFEARF